ncbi:hypothetical protein MKX01_004094, partial [Papaver californicum]
ARTTFKGDRTELASFLGVPPKIALEESHQKFFLQYEASDRSKSSKALTVGIELGVPEVKTTA